LEALKALSWYRNQKLKDEKDRDVWYKCYSYVNNWVDDELGQWDAETRGVLKSQGRPMISFNEVRKFVNRLCGAQRHARADEKAYPRDDQENRGSD